MSPQDLSFLVHSDFPARICACSEQRGCGLEELAEWTVVLRGGQCPERLPASLGFFVSTLREACYMSYLTLQPVVHTFYPARQKDP